MKCPIFGCKYITPDMSDFASHIEEWKIKAQTQRNLYYHIKENHNSEHRISGA